MLSSSSSFSLFFVSTDSCLQLHMCSSSNLHISLLSATAHQITCSNNSQQLLKTSECVNNLIHVILIMYGCTLVNYKEGLKYSLILHEGCTISYNIESFTDEAFNKNGCPQNNFEVSFSSAFS